LKAATRRPLARYAAPAVSFVGMIRFRFEGSSGRIAPQSQPSAEGTPTGKANEMPASPGRKAILYYDRFCRIFAGDVMT